MKSRTWGLLLFMLVIGLVLAGCSSDNDVAQADIEDAAPAAVATADDASPATAGDSTASTPALASVDLPEPESAEPSLPLELEVEVDMETGVDVGVTLPPAGIFEGATAALEALDSYRFITSFLFTGEEDGEIESGSIELSGEIMDANHRHFVWRDLGEGDQFEIIQLGDQAWVYDEDGWESVPTMVADAMSQAVLIFAPSIAWGGVFGTLDTQSTYVGLETIDGVSAHHYTSTYQQWGGYWQGDVLDATGDVWIAEAGYPLRYDFTAIATDEDGSQGSISWTMELTDVGEDIVIEAPL